jgi:hypothetical protein
MRFCEGRPERSTRPLTGEERVALEIAERRAARKAAFALAAVAVPFLVVPAGALVAAAVGVHPEGAVPALGTLALLAVLGGLPVAVVFARGAVRAVSGLRRDLRRGEVVVFGEGPDAAAVLVESRHVIGRAGVVVAPVRRAAVGEAAAPPPAPPTYALVDADVPPSLRSAAWVKRALSPEERAELERHARRFGRVSPALVVFSCVFGAVTAAGLSHHGATDVGVLPAVALALVLALDWWRVLRNRRAGSQLRADADEGWAFRGVSQSVHEYEVLPASGAFWTSAGAPAEWRLAPGARR